MIKAVQFVDILLFWIRMYTMYSCHSSDDLDSASAWIILDIGNNEILWYETWLIYSDFFSPCTFRTDRLGALLLMRL